MQKNQTNEQFAQEDYPILHESNDLVALIAY